MYKKLNEVKKKLKRSTQKKCALTKWSSRWGGIFFGMHDSIFESWHHVEPRFVQLYFKNRKYNYNILLCHDSYIYIRLKQVLQTFFFGDFILVYFDWFMLMISSYPTVAGFPSRLSWRGPRSRDLGSLPAGSFPGCAMVVMREGDWMCPSCGNHNYADKINCNRP